MPSQAPPTVSATRDAVLRQAAGLFYREGVRAVGMDLIVERSGIAKTTIYRHFPNKDALIKAFLESEDGEFWAQWEEVVAESDGTPFGALMALCQWVGGRVSRDNYRGCPQINVAAEFADSDHPARKVARRHKAEMVRRLTDLCRSVTPSAAKLAALQIGLLFDGAFMSDGRLRNAEATLVLKDAVEQLLSNRRDADSAS